MNQSQKLATLLLRIAGCATALTGVAAPLCALSKHVLTGSAVPTDDWTNNFFCFVGGSLLVALAKPLGRLLGRGLD